MAHGTSLENYSAKIRASGDCIVLPGSTCDGDTGVPIRDMLRRCEREFGLKADMTGYTCTIVTGGPGRGVEKYRSVDPGATEAGQIIQYAVSQGQDESRYIREELSLDTLGNLIFSTKTILEYGLLCPVFISQDEQIVRLKMIAKHWFGRSGIDALFVVAEDYLVHDGSESGKKMAEGERASRIKKEILRTALEDHSGWGFLEDFKAGTVSLPSRDWEECKWAVEVAIRWLFRHVKDGSGIPRYAASYDLDELLNSFLT